LLVVVFLGVALLLLRTGMTERAELPDGSNVIESVLCDDATVPAPTANVQPALVVLRGAISDCPDTRVGRSFVSEIFRPPMAPLARTS
jgi:hypothetical protein